MKKMGRPVKQKTNELNSRQKEVLDFVKKGLCNKDIAINLGLAERTIKYHMSSIYKKTTAKNREQLKTMEIK